MKSIVTSTTAGSLRTEIATAPRPADAATSLGMFGRGTFSIRYALRRFTNLYAAAVLSPDMRLRVLPLAFVVFVFPTLPVFAGTAEQSQFLQAQKLSDQGEFAQVIGVLEPLVHSASGALDDVTRGRAWNFLGSAYDALGNSEAARRSYEAAIQLLRTHPAASSIYASALNNLGSLDIYVGQLEAAKALLRKAKGLYTKADDHAGLAEVATDLSILALVRNDTHAARNLLSDAFGEAERAKDFNNSDRAEMYSTKGVLASRDRDFATAVLDYQRSIEFWIRARGPKCYFVALPYTFQADAYRELGEYGKAKSDITAALLLLEQNVGRNTGMYAATELAYARLLRATGANAEGAQREIEANALIKAMRSQQCNGCSISAAALR